MGKEEFFTDAELNTADVVVCFEEEPQRLETREELFRFLDSLRGSGKIIHVTNQPDKGGRYRLLCDGVWYILPQGVSQDTLTAGGRFTPWDTVNNRPRKK